MNIGFWENQLCERGTTIALYDYAYYNQTILQNKSFVFYDTTNRENKPTVITKFTDCFPVHGLTSFNQIEEYLKKYAITHLYIIKYGIIDDKITNNVKTCNHCVFNCTQPHGDVYASISPGVMGNNGKYPVVPHMINLPSNSNNLRNLLNIPVNAVVFGGYGGRESFSIKYVHQVVYYVAKNNPNIYFLFANFNKFCHDLPNIIHLPMIVDMNEKVRFINTTDAMLWARQEGETFGIAIGEFSSKNKPVIATKIGDTSHVTILKDKAFWYYDETSLYNILMKFRPTDEKDKDWNAYKNYTPEKVMEIFKEVFLD